MQIFECLPPLDRLRIEQVSKRWNQLAKQSSWSKYRLVLVEDFPGAEKRENRTSTVCFAFFSLVFFTVSVFFDSYLFNLFQVKMLKVLFIRCGRFIQDIDFHDFRVLGDSAIPFFPMLPNLQCISVQGVSEQWLSIPMKGSYKKLKSLTLYGVVSF